MTWGEFIHSLHQLFRQTIQQSQTHHYRPHSHALVDRLSTSMLLTVTDGEVSVYEFLLDHGRSYASAIGKATEISRTNVYYLLEQLEIKGLVSKSTGPGKRLFCTNHPDSLEEYLTAQVKEIDSNRKALHTIMNQLVSSYSLAAHKSGIFQFEGRDGLMKTFEEILRDELDMYVIEDYERITAVLGSYATEFRKRRVAKRLFRRIITVRNKFTEAEVPLNARKWRDYRFIDSESYPFDMHVTINEKKVVLTTYDENWLSGIIIVNPVITRNFRALFELLWDSLPKDSQRYQSH